VEQNKKTKLQNPPFSAWDPDHMLH